MNEKMYEGSIIDPEFTLYETKSVLMGVRQTSPGKDEICVEII